MLVSSLSLQRGLDCRDGHPVLFRNRVSEYRRYTPVKEVQDPIVHVLKPDPQFMNSLAKKVSFGAAKLMTQFR